MTRENEQPKKEKLEKRETTKRKNNVEEKQDRYHAKSHVPVL